MYATRNFAGFHFFWNPFRGTLVSGAGFLPGRCGLRVGRGRRRDVGHPPTRTAWLGRGSDSLWQLTMADRREPLPWVVPIAVSRRLVLRVRHRPDVLNVLQGALHVLDLAVDDDEKRLTT